jgi:hypothetical protein
MDAVDGNLLYSPQMDWQTTSRRNARIGVVSVVAFGTGIFLILVVVGRLTHADYMKDGLFMIFLVSVGVFAPIPLAIYGLARSAWKW